jgi:Bacterial mobilisation protein (MobC)
MANSRGIAISPSREIRAAMARYRADDASERRTEKLTVQLTPSERAELDAHAAEQGCATLSEYARELLFRRAALAIGRKRNPEAAGFMRELAASGNNLNQIARHLNTTGELRDWELRLGEAIELHKRAIDHVLDL